MEYKLKSIEYSITLNKEEWGKIYEAVGQRIGNNKFEEFIYRILENYKGMWIKSIYGNSLILGISFEMGPEAAEEAIKKVVSTIKYTMEAKPV